MQSIKGSVVAAALIAAIGVASGAVAQPAGKPQGQWGWNDGYTTGPWMMGPNGMMGGRGMGPWMMGGWNGQGASMCAMMNGHIDGRLAYLKTELKITDSQASLWDAYASAARDNAKAMTAHCAAMMTQAGSTTVSLPDRLDQHEQLMAAQLEALRSMNKALKPLYAALNDAQKDAANQLFWGPMGMM